MMLETELWSTKWQTYLISPLVKLFIQSFSHFLVYFIRRHNMIHPFLLKIFNGPPDLTVVVVPTKSVIYGGPVPGMPQDSSSVTITVRNQLSFLPGPIKMEEP